MTSHTTPHSPTTTSGSPTRAWEGSPSALPAILLAVQGFDLGRIADILDDEARRHGLDAVVDEVIFPALRTVGTFWAHGSFSVTHEHLFTAAATRWLYAQLNAATSTATAATPPTEQDKGISRRTARTIVLAAGPDDLHVIGLDCLELLLAARGVRVCNLGALVPTEALVGTATTLQAAAVVICSHARPEATSATLSLRAVDAAGIALYYAGSSFDSAFFQRRIPGTALPHSVAASADQLARLAGGPTTVSPAAARSHRIG